VVRPSRARSELRAISTPNRGLPFPPADTEVEMSVPLSVANLHIHRPESGSPRYKVLGSIHRGGMGEILLAKVEGPEGFSRKVVLKGLLNRLSEDDVSYRLFMREARLMSCLDHPNIVRVFDLPCLKGRPYLAMEYLRGRNFHQVIQRAAVKTGGVPVRIALAIVAQALRGLHYAHAMKDEQGDMLGIIHRDVSPGNLLVSFFGEVKVTDFGIAKLADSPRYTGPRSIRGKARYVAPEQVHGETASVLSDIYSAGVVLAEALLGEPLWERASIPETLLAIVTEDRDRVIDRVLADHESVPGLRAALRGSLALNPSDRFGTALQFAEVLEAIAERLGKPVSTVELGLYVRDLFRDAPDVPRGDGFGMSGFPIPKFGMGDESSAVDTDSTVIQLEPSWMKAQAIGPTTRMRPEAPRSLPPPLPAPMTPVPRDASALPAEPMGDGSSVLDLADTLVKRSEPAPRIKASPLPTAAAVADPADVLAEAAFVELPGRITEEEISNQVHALRRGQDPLAQPQAMTLLLAGIFIGAGLAISGGVIALLMGS
jgi:serine/threonine protein kinase